jgi:ribosomal protein L4
MELTLLNDAGQAAGKVQANDVVFNRDYNEPLIHQVVVAYQANARSGNRAQKDRSEVNKATKKPWRQTCAIKTAHLTEFHTTHRNIVLTPPIISSI